MYIQGKNIKTLSLKRLKTLITCIIALAMVFSQISVNALAAEEQVSYYDRDTGKIQSVSAEVVTNTSTAWNGTTKWYVVKDNITINTRITVAGDVHLILANGANLNAEKGIEVSDSNSLTIYAESAVGTGMLTAKGENLDAGIGGSQNNAGGTITITGGKVIASSEGSGAGIGGGLEGAGGTITITGGTVTASSGVEGAGIGSGGNGKGGTIRITGGTVAATNSGHRGGTGIGGGAGGSVDMIEITGGEINASSQSGAGIVGSKVKISDGKINASSNSEAGISGGIIEITGGEINASSQSAGAGIGGSYQGNGGNITITGGIINASSKTGAGIGGGHQGKGWNITITGGKVTASSEGGAGIGGGNQGNGGSITIKGGEITASSEKGGAGIGGGSDRGAGGNITITGGKINADGGKFGAGIGGGIYGDGGNINITGGTVTANAEYGAGIGGGGNNDSSYSTTGAGGNITITGGLVTANSKKASGIGGGKDNGSQPDGAAGSFSTGTEGKATIKTNSIADRTKESSWNGVVFEKDKGKVHGKAELTEDLTVENGQTLDIPDGSELTIPLGKNLNINGTLKNNGTINNNGNINNTGELKNTGEIKNAGTITGEVKNEGNGKVIKVYVHSGVIEPLKEKTSSENMTGKSPKNDKNTSTDNATTIAKAKISIKAKNVKGSISEAQISEKTVEAAIKKAKDNAKKNGNKADKISLEIKVDMPKGTDSSRLNITENALDKIIAKEIKDLAIDSPVAKTVFNKKAISEIKKQSKSDIVLSITHIKKLSKEAEKLIGKRPVYEMGISFLNKDITNNITKLEKGHIKVYIPYSIGKNEKAEGLYAVYSDKKGKPVKVKGSAYDKKSGYLIFNTKDLTIFGIGYKGKL